MEGFESSKSIAGREVEFAFCALTSQRHWKGWGVFAGWDSAVEQLSVGLGKSRPCCWFSSCPLSLHSEAGGPGVQGAKGQACGQGSHPVPPGGRGLPTA